MHAGYSVRSYVMGNQRYTSTTYSIGDLDERAMLPRMSSYRVLQYDYMRTLVLL